ncbi:hypothetical protein FC92_GL001092 [Liquorilactobacillus hordei DSM 19519]|uniref:Uncharacterized protein n=2 Tax=Liquorilactobacillus hordei TaxID=468911 RepID=A0A0R1MUD9_9LACO|nr:hypothetical protein FC92_GL001092 [Liquorilactobacillus hordei DSM 19519]
MFKTTHVGGVDFEQINTNSNVTLKEIDVANLIKSKNTVIVLYEAEHKMDCYNFEDESKLLSMVITY